jgi:purine nucleoside permease
VSFLQQLEGQTAVDQIVKATSALTAAKNAVEIVMHIAENLDDATVTHWPHWNTARLSFRRNFVPCTLT